MKLAPLRRSGAGAYVPIRGWLHYADHALAPMCRSSIGSYVPVGDILHRQFVAALASAVEPFEDFRRETAALQREVQTIQHQLEWFRRQLFGQKSEKRPLAPHPAQMHLGELPLPDAPPETPGKPVAGHTRRAPRTDFAHDKDESALFFDEARVPVETIALANPETEGLAPDQFEVIGEKLSHRLAQRPGSYVILKYVRPVIKRRDTQTLHCPAAPAGVIDGSRAWLTQLAAQAAALLEPIYAAQLASIRASRVKAMDETPIKAGRAGPGKMKGCYFWPVYGELDEVCFPFFENRAHNWASPMRFASFFREERLDLSVSRFQLAVWLPVKTSFGSGSDRTRIARSLSLQLLSPSVKHPASRSVVRRINVFEPCQPGFPVRKSSTENDCGRSRGTSAPLMSIRSPETTTSGEPALRVASSQMLKCSGSH